MSIQADDEFNLRLALDSELDGVTPGDGLAGLVIARHRRGRRRRFAGVVGLFVVFAGIGVPIGVASASGGAPARSRPVELRLGSYTLTLPDRYHLSDTAAAPCAAVTGARPAQAEAEAAVASGVCILMFFTPPGYVPPRTGAHQVTVVIEGEGRDLVIGATGMSRGGLDSLVSAGLRAA